MPTLDFTTTKHPWVQFLNAKAALVQYTGPSSYATGGDAFTPTDVKLGGQVTIFPELAVNAGGTVRGLQYDRANELLRWIVLDTGSEVANGTDLSGFSAMLLVVEG